MLQGQCNLALVLQSLKLTLELVAFDDEGVSLPQKFIPLAQGNIALLEICVALHQRCRQGGERIIALNPVPLEEHGPAPLNEFVAALSYMRGQTVRKHRRATVDARAGVYRLRHDRADGRL
jgi:hypothetical protein